MKNKQAVISSINSPEPKPFFQCEPEEIALCLYTFARYGHDTEALFGQPETDEEQANYAEALTLMPPWPRGHKSYKAIKMLQRYCHPSADQLAERLR